MSVEATTSAKTIRPPLQLPIRLLPKEAVDAHQIAKKASVGAAKDDAKFKPMNQAKRSGGSFHVVA